MLVELCLGKRLMRHAKIANFAWYVVCVMFGDKLDAADDQKSAFCDDEVAGLNVKALEFR